MTQRVIEEPESTCFLTQWLPDRMQILDVPIGGRQPASIIKDGSKTLELVTAKTITSGTNFVGQKKTLQRYFYIKTSGSDVTTINLREELEKIANFRDEPSTLRKLVVRLELLTSPSASRKAPVLHAKDFELIPEPKGCDGEDMSDGCGFIPDAMLLRLVGGGTGALAAVRAINKKEDLHVKMNVNSERKLWDLVTEMDAKRAAKILHAADDDGESVSCAAEILQVMAIQVRVIGPGLGIAKGMLMRKQGITKIQLPPSMLKKGGPTCTAAVAGGEDWVSLVVSEMFPSRMNTMLGKLIGCSEEGGGGGDDEEVREVKRAPKSFIPTELSDMFTRLWEALGVPSVDIFKYKDRVKKYPASIAHAWLVGVTDPTGCLPAGHIFVTGTVGTAVLDSPELFITRSPAIKASDGCMLPVLSQRPAAMSPDEWDWLVQLPFGAVLFSTAGVGAPLASTVADGDLDGDLYLVCWELDILRNINIKPVDVDQTSSSSFSSPSCDELKTSSRSSSTVFLAEDSEMLCNDDTWLEQVQAHLIDPSVLGESNKHMRQLYKRMVKVQLERGYGHPDARALGDAYVQALERSKHGKAITLPVHLHF